MSKAKIANRNVDKPQNLLVKCDSCKTFIRPTMIMRNGKKRMITACGCWYISKSTADLTMILGV